MRRMCDPLCLTLSYPSFSKALTASSPEMEGRGGKASECQFPHYFVSGGEFLPEFGHALQSEFEGFAHIFEGFFLALSLSIDTGERGYGGDVSAVLGVGVYRHRETSLRLHLALFSLPGLPGSVRVRSPAFTSVHVGIVAHRKDAPEHTELSKLAL